MQLFGGMYNPASGFSGVPCPGHVCPDEELEEPPKYHFDYIGPAMMTTFILMSGEWVDAMEPLGVGRRRLLHRRGVIGRYLVMNLFVGMLVIAFSEDDEDEGDGGDGGDGGEGEGEDGAASPGAPPPPARRAARRCRTTGEAGATPRARATTAQRERGAEQRRRGLGGGAELAGRLVALIFSKQNPLRRSARSTRAHVRLDRRRRHRRLLDHPRPRHAAQRPDSLLAGRSSTPSSSRSSSARWWRRSSPSASSSRRAYLHDPWHQLGLSIVLISLAAFLAEAFPQLKPLKSLRVLRALRPLASSRVPA